MTESEIEYTWSDIRDEAIDTWGSAPQGQLEADILDAFVKHPELVLATIERITHAYHAGNIRNPWAVLRTDLAKTATPEHNPTVKTSRDRDKTIARAEQWIKNAGCMYDRWEEVEDELFGDRGMLHQWRTDNLEQRIRKAWEAARPTGEQIEADELNRAEAWKTNRAKLEALPKVPHPEPKAAA